MAALQPGTAPLEARAELPWPGLGGIMDERVRGCPEGRRGRLAELAGIEGCVTDLGALFVEKKGRATAYAYRTERECLVARRSRKQRECLD